MGTLRYPHTNQAATLYYLVVNIGIFVAGLTASRLQPTIARAFVCFSVIFAMFGIVVLAATGALHYREPLGDIHRWIGVILTAVDWTLAVFSAGVILGDRQRLGCVYRGLALVAVTTALLVSCSASRTGYLYPHDIADPAFHEETANRFYILHCVAVPSVLFGLHFCWLAAMWPRRPVDSAIPAKEA